MSQILGRDFSIELSLHCSTTGKTSHGSLTLDSFPLHGSDLKKEIEIAHEIPTFAQTRLTFGEQSDSQAEIRDDDRLSNTLLRNGDIVRVTYIAKAECKEVERVVKYLETLAESLKENLPTSHNSASAVILSQAFSGGIAQLLRQDLFMPWTSEVKQMNKEVFLRKNGLQYLIQLLHLVHTRTWDRNTHNLRLLEIILLETLHPLAAVFKFRRLLAQKGVVELCLKSLLRTKLDRRATFGLDPVLPYMLAKAMTTLCNMCELQETSLNIGSSPEALEQFICIAHSSHYDIWHAEVALNLFACLSPSKEVHRFLASDNILGGILDICVYRTELGESALNVMLLRYYAQLVFMQLIVLSPSYISLISLKRIEHHMTNFLNEVDPLALSKHEVSSGNFWSVFTPFVNLLYVPKTPLKESGTAYQLESLISRLQLSSIHSALIALHIIILSCDDGHHSLNVMRHENLIPYIIAAPSHVPPSLQFQATELVRCLRCYMSIEPPTLADLAKASLAKCQFGLERILNLQTPYELVEDYYSSC